NCRLKPLQVSGLPRTGKDPEERLDPAQRSHRAGRLFLLSDEKKESEPVVLLPVKSTNPLFTALFVGRQDSRVTDGNATSRSLGSDAVSNSRKPHGTPTFSFPFVLKNGTLWENRSNSLDGITNDDWSFDFAKRLTKPLTLTKGITVTPASIVNCCIMLQPSVLNSEIVSIKTSYSSIIPRHAIKVIIKCPYLINCKQIRTSARIKVKKFWVRTAVENQSFSVRIFLVGGFWMLLASICSFLLEDLRGLWIPVSPGFADVSTPRPRFCPSTTSGLAPSDAILLSAFSFAVGAEASHGFLVENSSPPFPLVSVWSTISSPPDFALVSFAPFIPGLACLFSSEEEK
ncbi:hypothetical protein EJB05_15258, partial [Eragrostis curvula]